MNSTSAAPEEHFDFKLYRYTPSLAAAVLFAVIFFACSAVHTYQLLRTRTWYFIPLIVGGYMEALGYVGRILSHSDTEALGPYIMQSLLLLVAPALFAASIYMVLGRLLRHIDAEGYALVPPRWLTKAFVGGDVLAFTVQASGGGVMASGTLDAVDTGSKIVIAGLFLQILFFGFFVVVAVAAHMKIRKKPTIASGEDPMWAKMLAVLYATSALILARSVFRVIEYVEGNDGYLMSNEVWLYIFDALLMAPVLVLFSWMHPARVIGRKEVLGRDGQRVPLQNLE